MAESKVDPRLVAESKVDPRLVAESMYVRAEYRHIVKLDARAGWGHEQLPITFSVLVQFPVATPVRKWRPERNAIGSHACRLQPNNSINHELCHYA
jgi:hypothetical protein